MIWERVRFGFGTLAFVIGCSGSDGEEGAPAPGIDLAAMDESVDPCEDFYRYACGGWQQSHPLTAAASAEHRFDDASRAMVPQLLAILKQEAKGARASDDPYAYETGKYYQACLQVDVSSRARLAAELAAIYETSSAEQLMGLVGKFRRRGSSSFVRFGVGRDPADTSHYILWLQARGWEMPEREDYLDDSRAARRIAYLEHIRRLAAFVPGIPLDAASALEVETALVSASLERELPSDPNSLYHPIGFSDLESLAPHVPFKALLQAQGITPPATVNVTEPDYVKALDAVFVTTPLSKLQHYVAWQFLQDEASYLDEEVQRANFSFWGPEFMGRSEAPSLDWTCYQDTTATLGWALSRPWVSRHSSASTWVKARQQVTELRAALRARLVAASWMDEATRAEALAKADAVIDLVGRPNDGWPSLPAFDFGFDYLANHWRINELAATNSAEALGARSRRDAWRYAPLVVNAFYFPDANVIEFPAAFLQPPFFQPDATRANQLGSLGSVIGHELTHGFDATGRFYDDQGNLRNFWSDASAQAFDERSNCLVSQYSQFEVLPSLFVDGRLTVTENAADMGGLRLAYDALRASGDQAPVWNGFDNEQQFFLSFAQLHCENEQPTALRQSLATDPHSPGVARVNATLANLPEFAAAFSCAAGTAMVNPEPCSVW